MKYRIEKLPQSRDEEVQPVGDPKGYHTRKAALHAIKHQMKVSQCAYRMKHPDGKEETFIYGS